MSGSYSEIISKRFREILNSKGWTYAEYLKNKGLTDYKNSIDNIYYGRSEDPRISTLSIIAESLDVGINCLIGKCHHTPEERAILAHYKNCGEHGKAVIEIVAKYEAVSAKKSREATDKISIPCMVPRKPIYAGIAYDTCDTEEIETDVKEAHIAIKITTNDLVPIFCKGDCLLIENRFPDPGEYGVFYFNGRAYIRKYIEEDNGYRLKCIHDKGEDMFFKRLDSIEYMGTCIDVIRI